MLTISGAFISVVGEWLHAQGYGASPLYNRIKKIRPDQTIDVDTAESLLAEAVAISGQSLAALQIGGMVKKKHLGSISYMLASARTLEQMLSGYVYYESIFYGKNIANLRRSELGVELYWAFSQIPENYARFAMGSFASAIEEMGLPRSSIMSVSFPFLDEKKRADYLNEIGCGDVLFGQSLGILFSKPSLQLSLKSEHDDKEKQKIVSRLLPELSDNEFAEHLFDEIVYALPQGKAKLNAISKHMALSERTLQRRLAQSNDGLRGVINRVRMHLACEYLQDKGMSLLAVSLLLGYSEQSALHLAFKRFYGMSPGQWRIQNCESMHGLDLRMKSE